MKNSLWVVFVVTAGFLGFLIGHGVQSYTDIQKMGYMGTAESGGYEEAGGDGKESAGDREESADFGERLEYFGEKQRMGLQAQ